MKLLACDICEAVVLLGFNLKSCRCKNIKGKYIDNRNIIVYVKDKSKSRILGIQNSIRYGLKKKGDVWIIDYNDQTVKVIDI